MTLYATRDPFITDPRTYPHVPSGVAAKAAIGKTWEDVMIGDATGFRFEPTALLVKAGDAVRWTVIQGRRTT